MVRSFFSSFYALLLALGLTCLLVVTLVLTGAEHLAGANPLAAAEVYLVDSLTDDVDADLNDGLCRTAGGTCTLRAAIMQANAATGVQTITLPAGVFTLTRVGADDTAQAGDLDITSEIVIDGAGADRTIVDGNGPATSDRVFHVLGGGGLVARGLTIRNGTVTLASPNGGGLLCQSAGGLSLERVVVEGNSALTGGGIAADGCALTIADSIVRANTASTTTVGFARRTSDGPRGLGEPSVAEKIIPVGFFPLGGGVYLDGSHVTTIARTEIVSNSATSGGGIANHQTTVTQSGRLSIVDSTIRANRAGDGGGLESRAGLQVRRTVIERNEAAVLGGGVVILVPFESSEIDIADSTLRDNRAQDGGAIAFVTADTGRVFTLRNSTLNGNLATRDGGAIQSLDKVRFGIVDTTIDHNSAGRHGGGIAAYGESRMWLSNVTLTDNRLLPSSGTEPSLGTGLFITATAALTVQNTILAGNVREGSTIQPPSECFVNPTTSLRSNGYNLIQFDLGCSLSGTTFGNIVGVDPGLGPLSDNGGWTKTRLPQASRPTYNRGDLFGCKDHAGLPIAFDQRGVTRDLFARCDIGAVEYFAFPVLTNVRPAVVPARPEFTLVLTGEQLIPNTLVLWNGALVPTHYLDSQTLTVTIPSNLVTATGVFSIGAQYGSLTSPIPSEVTVTVVGGDQFVSFGPQPARAFNDPPFPVSASASSGLPVVFQAKGVCAVSGNTVTPIGVGSCTIIASQPGDALYNPAPPVQQTFPVGPAIPRPIFVPGARKS